MKSLFLTGVLFIFTFYSYASDTRSEPSGPFLSSGDGPHYCLDYTTFKGTDAETYMELYFQVGYADLQFIKSGDRFTASYSFDVVIMEEGKKIAESYSRCDTFHVETFEDSESLMTSRSFQLSLYLAPGNYSVHVDVTDHETRKTSSISEKLSVPSFTDTDKLLTSDLQISHRIEPAAGSGPFIKNSRKIYPNAAGNFLQGINEFFLYFEIYNLGSTSEDSGEYSVRYIIKDDKNKTMTSFAGEHAQAGPWLAHSAKLPISGLPEGRYAVVIRIEDTNGERTARLVKEFQLLHNFDDQYDAFTRY